MSRPTAARGGASRAPQVLVVERVLDDDDARRFAADPARCFERGAFEDLLDALADLAPLVSLEALRAARAGGPPPPERALLLCLDGGWADAADTALPALVARGLPAAACVPAEVVGRDAPRWPDQVFGAWSEGRLSPEEADALWRAAAPGAPPPARERWGDPRSLWALVGHLAALEAPARAVLLDERAALLTTDGRRLTLSAQELAELAAGGVEVALLCEPDAGPEDDVAARATLAAHLGGAAPRAAALPEGAAWSAARAAAARAAGLELLLGASDDTATGEALPRLSLDPREVCAGGGVSERALARLLAGRPAR